MQRTGFFLNQFRSTFLALNHLKSTFPIAIVNSVSASELVSILLVKNLISLSVLATDDGLDCN